MGSHQREVCWYLLLAFDDNPIFAAAAVLFGQDRGATPNIFHAELNCPGLTVLCECGLSPAPATLSPLVINTLIH